MNVNWTPVMGVKLKTKCFPSTGKPYWEKQSSAQLNNVKIFYLLIHTNYSSWETKQDHLFTEASRIANVTFPLLWSVTAFEITGFKTLNIFSLNFRQGSDTWRMLRNPHPVTGTIYRPFVHEETSSSSSALQPWVGLGLLLRFRYNIFLWGGVVSLTPNPQHGGPGYPFLSGSSPLTCLAWEALPVANATVSIALGIIWPHKPRHYTKATPLHQSRDTFGGDFYN
jgi:hypothetical protein